MKSSCIYLSFQFSVAAAAAAAANAAFSFFDGNTRSVSVLGQGGTELLALYKLQTDKHGWL